MKIRSALISLEREMKRDSIDAVTTLATKTLGAISSKPTTRLLLLSFRCLIVLEYKIFKLVMPRVIVVTWPLGLLPHSCELFGSIPGVQAPARVLQYRILKLMMPRVVVVVWLLGL